MASCKCGGAMPPAQEAQCHVQTQELQKKKKVIFSLTGFLIV
jgi:hypothetical protein